MRLRLKRNADPEEAFGHLDTLARDTLNAVTLARSETTQRQEYIRWVAATERSLYPVMHREDAAAIFDTPRYREICSMVVGSHLRPLLYAEIESRAALLEEYADELFTAIERARRAPGVPVVVDKNAMLQSWSPDELRWQDELGDLARVIVPLRVIEELEGTARSRSDPMSDAARELLAWIDKLFPEGDEGVVPISDTATIEVLLADRPRHRPEDANEEILDAAHEVAQLSGGSVLLLTGDTGMRIRARSEGLEVLALPESWRRPPDSVDNEVASSTPEASDDSSSEVPEGTEPVAGDPADPADG